MSPPRPASIQEKGTTTPTTPDRDELGLLACPETFGIAGAGHYPPPKTDAGGKSRGSRITGRSPRRRRPCRRRVGAVPPLRTSGASHRLPRPAAGRRHPVARLATPRPVRRRRRAKRRRLVPLGAAWATSRTPSRPQPAPATGARAAGEERRGGDEVVPPEGGWGGAVIQILLLEGRCV